MIDFPNSPTNGQVFTSVNTSWIYDGSKWVAGNNPAVFLPLTGGTLTGQLRIAPTSGWSSFVLVKPSSGQSSTIYGYLGANARWQIDLGNATVESGSNVGSDFTISRFSDAGAFLATSFLINRATGTISITTPLGAGGAAQIPPGGYAQAVHTSLVTTGWLGFNAYVNAAGTQWMHKSGTGYAGDFEFGSSSGSFVWYIAPQVAKDAQATMSVAMTLVPSGNLTANGWINAGGSYRCAGRDTLWNDGAYTFLIDPTTGSGAAYFGNSNYYRTTTGHIFQNAGGSVTWAKIEPTQTTIYGFIVATQDIGGANVIVQNNKGLYGANTSGANTFLIGVNSANQITLGNNSYTVNIQGPVQCNSSIYTIGATAILQFQARDLSRTWGLYSDSGGAYLWTSDSGNRIVFGSDALLGLYNHIRPMTDNTHWCGVGPWLQSWYYVSSYNYQTASDGRLKTDFAELPNCLDLVRNLAPKLYRMTNSPENWRRHWGFVAQDVGAVMDAAGHDFSGGYRVDIVPETGDTSHGISYNALTAVLWKAVQELSAEVQALREKVG